MPADFIRANVVTAAFLAASLGIVCLAFRAPAEPNVHVDLWVLHHDQQDRGADRDDPPDCSSAPHHGAPDDCDDDDGPELDEDRPIQT